MLTLTIPAPCEPLSANQRLHWRVKAERVALWRRRAHLAVLQIGSPSLAHAHITATLHSTTNRRRDVLNLADTIKACIDGIVQDGHVLPDDSDRYVVGPDLRPGEKAPKFAVTITLDDTCRCVACVERFEATA